MSFEAGDTFHYGEVPNARHLHIVLFASTNPGEPVIFVSVNTVRRWTDSTLILKVGDHPFIVHNSAVSYNRVDSVPLFTLTEREERSRQDAPGFRNFDHDVPITPTLLQMVIQGALESPLTSRRMKTEIRRRLNLPV